MAIRFHPHAHERMQERGATEEEVKITIESGESFPAKFGRTGFRSNFSFFSEWRGKFYNTRQGEAYAANEQND